MSERTPRYHVAGTGSMVLDRIHRAPRILGPDEKIELCTQGGRPLVYERPGGVTLNHLAWARILGLRAAIFGRQADDREGRLLRQAMDRLGIVRVIDTSGVASSFAEIVVDDAGERSIYMAPGATGDLPPEDIDAQFSHVIEAATFVTTEVSQLPLATVRRVLERARACGARTVLDLDLPRSEAVPRLGSAEDLAAVLSLCDVLKLSAAALRGWIDVDPPERAVERLRAELGVGLAVLTLGPRGAVVGSDAGCSTIKALAVEVRDTTGAGDAFLGGLVTGLWLGLAPLEAARLGNACGAACCERVGAFPDDPGACRDRVQAHLRSLGGPLPDLPPFEGTSEGPGASATSRFLAVATDQLERLAQRADRGAIERASEIVLDAEARGGRVHVTGVGKPAYVAGYLAALLSSTGTPATFLDATEATHGSAGQLRSGDVLIAISNSGSTAELLSALDAALGMGVHPIAVTAAPSSPLASRAEVTLRADVEEEGGPLGLAPRASILAELLVLQALSVELQARRSFGLADYHRRHPGGALGRRSREP